MYKHISRLFQNHIWGAGMDINETLPAGMVMAAIIKVSHSSTEAPVKHTTSKKTFQAEEDASSRSGLCQDGRNGKRAVCSIRTNNKLFLYRYILPRITDVRQ